MTPGELLAVVVRGGVTESVHLGHLVVCTADRAVIAQRGEPGRQYFPRSSLKPLQVAAMVAVGLDLPADQLAQACASHSGEPVHVRTVRAMLDGAGLGEDDLQNTPDLPLDPAAALAWRREGRGPASVTQNCSGKHAAMLATAAHHGWDTATYLEHDHPLQQAIRARIEQLTGEPVAHATVDGCGAPLFSTTLTGLARAFATIATADPASPEGRVAAAMRAHPELVGGTGRDVTEAMRAVPGLVAKDGAEGVYAAGLPDGVAVAFKISDGSARPRPTVLAAALELAGVTGALEMPWAHVPVLGHGRPVGEVRPWTAVAGTAAGVEVHAGLGAEVHAEPRAEVDEESRTEADAEPRTEVDA